MGPVLGTVSALAGVVAISYLVEALRRSPRPPDVLPWAPGVPIRHVIPALAARYHVYAVDLPGHARGLYLVGNRPGHPRAFASLVHHWPSWEEERERYGDIRVPVLLLYGDQDLSRPEERAETARRIPGAASHTVESAGHFLSFDAPEDVIPRVVEFVDRLPARLPS